MSVPTNITWDLGRAQEGSCGCVLLNSEGEIEVWTWKVGGVT